MRCLAPRHAGGGGRRGGQLTWALRRPAVG